MADKKNLSETEIEDLLSQAGDATINPGAGLLARIVADADRVLTEREEVGGQQTGVDRPGLLDRIFGTLGGWPAVAGLTTATVAGIWIGYAAPDALIGVTQGYVSIGVSDTMGDFMPTFTDILSEG